MRRGRDTVERSLLGRCGSLEDPAQEVDLAEVLELVGEDAALLSEDGRERVAERMLRETVGLGPLEELLRDPLVEEVVADLGGHAFTVADEDRTRYHAAAVIASNHLVALLGQVERVAPDGVPLEAFMALVRGTVDNVAALGPAAALTGPVARGDWAPVERHLAALPEDERPAYEVMVAQARRLVG